MARRPPEDDPRITDLRRYRKEREQRAKRKPAQPPRPPGQSFLGSNRWALPILILVIVVIALFYLLPAFL